MNGEYILDLYNNKNYIEATRRGLEIIKKIPKVFKVSKVFFEYFVSIKYSFLSAYEEGLYKDAYSLGSALYGIAPFKLTEFPDMKNRICLLERYLESSIYCVINKESEFIDNTEEIILALEKLYKIETKEPTEIFINCKKMYSQYINGQRPYYVIDCMIGFHIPINDGSYEVNSLDNLKEVSIKRVIRNEGTENELHYTQFKLYFNGFIKATGDWRGPSLNDFFEMYNTRNAMKYINELLVYVSKYDNYNYYPRVYAEQITTHVTTQYFFTGELYHFCSFSNFCGDTIIGKPRKDIFGEKENDLLKALLLNSEKLPIYEMLLIIGRGDVSVGQYTEAFMLLNSAMEAQIYHFSKKVAEKFGKKGELEDFEKPISRCNNCELRLNNQQVNLKNESIMPPSIFKYASFLCEMGIISNEEKKELNSYIARGRNDNLRNTLMHGKQLLIQIQDVKVILEMIEKIELFYGKLLNSKN